MKMRVLATLATEPPLPADRAVLFPDLLKRDSHDQTNIYSQDKHLAPTIDISLSSEPLSMGSASPNTTASHSIAQLTLTGPVFPYTALTSGLNKTDASFAALIRCCLGEGGPP